MAKSLAYSITLVLAIALTFTLTIHQTIAEEDCKEDMTNLGKSCMEFLKPEGPKKDPSKQCCAVVQKCNVKCVCAHVTPEIEKVVSMEKVVYVAAKCGSPLEKGSKCGSYQVPEN